MEDRLNEAFEAVRVEIYLKDEKATKALDTIRTHIVELEAHNAAMMKAVEACRRGHWYRNRD